MNLHEKILAIMQDVQYLAKDDQVKFGTTAYKALSEEKVTSIMRAELLKHKLVVYPFEQTATRTGTITHVDTRYRLVNAEDPLDYIDIASAGDGADTQDKGTGKAMTYAYKYMWLRTFALPTGEDPDKICSAELDAKATAAQEKEKQAKTQAISERLTARALCQQAVKLYCQQHSTEEKEAWKIIAETIGKPSKDFTTADWRQGEQIAKGWK